MSDGLFRFTNRSEMEITPHFSGWLLVITLFFSSAVGIILRVIRFGDDLFPVSDGALFLTIAEAIQTNQMALPNTVMFNSYELPFAYPPLGIWAVAAISTISGIDSLTILALFPLACNLLFVIAFAVMLLTLRLEWGYFLVAFAVLLTFERSYEYLIMGGGVTRSAGSLFAVLSITAAILFRKNHSIWLAIVTGTLCGLSILSHLEWGIVCASAVAVFVLLGSGSLFARLGWLILIGLVSFVCLLPWLYFLVTGPGLEPLSYASQTSGWSLKDPVESVVGLSFIPKAVLIFGAIGAWELAQRRQFEWHFVALAIIFFTPRHADSALVIPNSVFVAYGVMAIWRLVIGLISDDRKGQSRFAIPVFLTLFLIAVGMNVFAKNRNIFTTHPTMEVLTSTTRAGMEWTTSNIDSTAVFFVHSNEPWYVDEVAEWFPYLSGHFAVNTVQGTEWLPDEIWAQKVKQYDVIQRSRNCTEVIEKIWRIYPTVSHIFTTTDLDCMNLSDDLRRIWFQNDVGIYERVDGKA